MGEVVVTVLDRPLPPVTVTLFPLESVELAEVTFLKLLSRVVVDRPLESVTVRVRLPLPSVVKRLTLPEPSVKVADAAPVPRVNV